MKCRGSVVLFVCSMLSACAGAGARARPVSLAFGAPPRLHVSDEQCVSWLSARRTWNAVALGSGAGAGLAGGSSMLLDSDAGRITVGVSAIVLGILGTVASAVERGLSGDFERFCEPPPPTP